MQPVVEVIGVVDRVISFDEKSGQSQLRMRVVGYAEPVPVHGVISSVTPGDALECKGEWKLKDSGVFFDADHISKVHPSIVRSKERSLVSLVLSLLTCPSH